MSDQYVTETQGPPVPQNPPVTPQEPAEAVSAPPVASQAPSVPEGSLKERAAERRRKLHEQRQEILSLIGYEDLGIFVRYNVLSYKDMRRVNKRHEKALADPKQEAEGECLVAADTLIASCVEFLEKTGEVDGVAKFRVLGGSWSTAGVQEVFGFEVESSDPRREPTARDAIRAVLPDTELIMHFRDYAEALGGVHQEIEEEMLGE